MCRVMFSDDANYIMPREYVLQPDGDYPGNVHHRRKVLLDNPGNCISGLFPVPFLLRNRDGVICAYSFSRI